ncbi:hypothetical protein BB561_001129 [Smittium simulii]|uniref:DNA damage-binding protein CMR1 n=1 Tax=Smittium simulii TaxID=133385 RepID=A0A2T9YW07_9FUNG|nr:hypothetical protein BB561_001129 [Smittium simulii]
MSNKYEEQRLENIRKNQEMLASLGLDKVSTTRKKPSLNKKAPGIKTESNKTQSTSINKRKNSIEAKQEPTRRSARLRGIKTEVTDELIDFDKKIKTEGESYSYSTKYSKPFIPPLDVSVGLEDIGDSEQNVKYFKIVAEQVVQKSEEITDSQNSVYEEAERHTEQKEIQEILTLKNLFSDMKIRHEEANIPIVDSRIYSLAFHPNADTESLLVCAGDKFGTLGFCRLGPSDFSLDHYKKFQTDKKSPSKMIKKEKLSNNNILEKNSKKSTNKKVNVYEQSVQPDLFSFRPHTEAISSIVIPTQSPNNVYTSAYDGTIRILDLNNPTSFNQIMKLDDDHMITSMDLQFSHGVCPLVWFTTTIGIAGFTDSREHNSTIYKHMFHNNRVHCISPNPKDKNIISTSSLDRTFRIWDIRNMFIPLESHLSAEPNIKLEQDSLSSNTQDYSANTLYDPVELDIHKERGCVTSAYFSPDGNRIVSTSFNNIVSLWSWDSKSLKVTDKQFTRHNNRTGRWLSMFRGRWHPNLELPSCFVVGNMDQSIDIFSGHSLSLVSNIKDRQRISTVPAVAVFHNKFPVIASGNASGKLSVWS